MWYYNWEDSGIPGPPDEDEDEPQTEKSPATKNSNEKPGTHTHRCVRCQEPFGFVEANQEDGTFKCYLCRQDPFR